MLNQKFDVTVESAIVRDGRPVAGNLTTLVVRHSGDEVFRGDLGSADNLRHALALGLASARRMEDV